MSTIKVRWSVDELENVISLFDVQKVYRAADPTGPWSEITSIATRVPLVSGQSDYLFDDGAGSPDFYYSIAYYNTVTFAESDKSTPMRGDITGVQYLTTRDMEGLIGANKVRQLFDDDNNGSTENNIEPIYQAMAAAEAEAANRMLRSFSDEQINILAENDRAFKNHVAWVACEFASERRSEFQSIDGWGGYKAQYERAITYFENLSKAKTRSKGEAKAGKSARLGGGYQPNKGNAPKYIFAPDTKAPTGHGGF